MFYCLGCVTYSEHATQSHMFGAKHFFFFMSMHLVWYSFEISCLTYFHILLYNMDPEPMTKFLSVCYLTINLCDEID